MKNNFKKFSFGALFLAFVMIFLSVSPAAVDVTGDIIGNAEEADSLTLNLDCKSAVLMEAATGKVLYEQNPDEALLPASVTKIMTLLLVMEAVDGGTLKLDDMITASANAASMGGSQIYLKEGESMSAEDMIKSVTMASANDAAVALAEHIAGSEEAFVARMNERARELGMTQTNFENTNGLDDTVSSHVTSARDIAIMSRELIGHETIKKYSTLWMDSIRGGAFVLTNTNRLVRFYNGCTGLKTGSTSKAHFCVSATAERDGTELIAVIMASPTRDIRNAEAKKLLDYGFSNFALYRAQSGQGDNIKVIGGTRDICMTSFPEFVSVLPKGNEKKVETKIEMKEQLAAPVRVGDVAGCIKYVCGGEVIGESNIICTENIPKIDFGGLLLKMIVKFLLK